MFFPGYKLIADDFDTIWNEALVRCVPELKFSAAIARLKCNFYSSCDWTLFFLKQLLSYHHFEQDYPFTYLHEIIIIPTDEPQEPLLLNPVLTWKGTVPDGTPMFMLKLNDCVVQLQIGNEVSMLINIAVGRTLCKIKEIHVDNNSRRRPQPGGYFLPLIQLLLSAYNLYVVHASAVAFQEKALLLLGQSGAGKTTMSLALARAGLEFIGDDLVIVVQQEGRLLSYAFLLKPKIEVAEEKTKKTVDFVSSENISICRSADLAGVVLLQRGTDNDYKLTKSLPSQALLWLLNQSNDLRLMWYPQKWFDTASAIANRIPGWIWTIGHPDKLNAFSIRGILNCQQ